MADGACDLSIIMPTYNYARFLGPALQSVLDQVPGHLRVEVVVVDDGSTDDTEAVVRKAGPEPAIRYRFQPNAGPASARNLGLAEAKGRYLMFMDADDALMPGCIERTVDFLDRHPEVGYFFTNYEIHDAERVLHASGVDIWRGFRALPHREVAGDEWVFEGSLAQAILRDGAFMHTTGLTLRREVYQQVEPFREGFAYAEDDEFYVRVARVATAGYVDRVLSRKRSHADSLIHDPANQLRNTGHALELAELQRRDFAGDAELSAILTDKIRRLAIAWCWGLVHAGRRDEARAALNVYRSRYPGYWGFYWLWVRSWLPGGRG